MSTDNLRPDILEKQGRFDSFSNGEILHGKKKNHLPAMGWNSWNAFGSGNTEILTRAMADMFIELGLDKLGYEYIILDDGCYKNERINGLLSNDELKFPSGFKNLSDYVHSRNLKFGMYNDIGTNLCAGAAVGTCGHERDDAGSYLEWGVDFLKVDNCYYPWDNATFSNPENARYTFAPNIRSIMLDEREYSAISDAHITGKRAFIENDHITGIGTFDGTGPDATPVGDMSSELVFEIDSDSKKEVRLSFEYATGAREGVGSWLQIAVNGEIILDDFVKETESEDTFIYSAPIMVELIPGTNRIRFMNHRRQENTLNSYSRLVKELNDIDPDNNIIFSACEWGKTQPQNWAYKVCDSWRILNDISFKVGRDGDAGEGAWTGDYTTSVTAQYNKAVIMDEFSGLSRGWNDPDMLMVGMNGLNMVQSRTHMTMWSMMNSPLMLGLDLRRVKKDDDLYNIIANKDIISLNQDKMGIQAKRLYSSLAKDDPSTEYIRDINRVDILVKPLEGGKFAISFINVSLEDKCDSYTITAEAIKDCFKDKVRTASKYHVKNLWSGEESDNVTGSFEIDGIKACDNETLLITPLC